MMPRSISVSYIDVLTCLFTIFIIMFILSEDSTNKKGNTIDPSQFIIEATWSDDSWNDIDLWAENPSGNIVFYRDRELGGMTLDTDNLGINNSTKTVDGKTVKNVMRREVISIRTVVPGTYTFNVMLYGKRTEGTEKVRIHIIKLNPYLEIIEKTVNIDLQGDEVTVAQLTIDEDGNFISMIDNPDRISLFNRMIPK